MNKQRICVVGDGLTGLMTAITLNNIPELEVNLVAKKQIRNKTFFKLKPNVLLI